MTVRTRWAPSPTGYAHLGFISRILINYALARKHNGQFVWRNEDTDQERLVADALEYNMKWVREFGFDWDEGPDDTGLPAELRKGGPYAPYTQSKRAEQGIYQQAIDKLIANDYAYRCFCSKERLTELRRVQEMARQQTRYDGHCRHLSPAEVEQKLADHVPFTIRLKVPRDRSIEFDDLITHNHVVWDSNEVDDAIIVKSNGIPTYHLAAMYDDALMRITHAMRGAEWLASTPLHILIFEGLGIRPEERPQIGHFTVILDPATPGKKMSKRNQSFRVNGLLQQGYLREAILNYLMLLGWAPKDNRELFTLTEFVEAFDLSGMQKANPTWNQAKMDWFNGVYLRKLTPEEYTKSFLEWISKYLLTASDEELAANFATETVSLDRVKKLLDFARELTTKDPVGDDDHRRLQDQLALVQERALNFWQALGQIEFFYHAPTQINWEIKQTRNLLAKLPDVLRDLHSLHGSFASSTREWTHDAWEAGIRSIADQYGLKHGDVFMALRLAVVGAPFSPPLFESLQLMEREEILRRISGS